LKCLGISGYRSAYVRTGQTRCELVSSFVSRSIEIPWGTVLGDWGTTQHDACGTADLSLIFARSP
jgi:hypothetical protein